METLVVLLLSLLSGVIPTAVYALIFWWLDKYEKEPWWLLSAAFFWGAVPAVILSVLAEVLLGNPAAALGPTAAKLIEAGVIAPVVEEVVKGLALAGIFCVARRELDGVLDGVIYGALVGFGFGMTENVFYFLGSYADGGWIDWGAVVLLRATVFGLNHAFFTGLTGAGVGLARLSRSWWQGGLIGIAALGLAILFHAAHNIFSSMAETNPLSLGVTLLADWGGVLLIFVVIRLAWRDERGWISRELAEEVARGVLSQAEFDTALSYRRRLAAQARLMLTHGWSHSRQFGVRLQLATRLAFKKHQLRTLGRELDVQTEIERLRAALREG